MNVEASTRKCQDLLMRLNAKISNKLKSAQYSKSGGFTEFTEDVKTVEQQYERTEDLGKMV